MYAMKKLADELNGRQYLEEMTRAEVTQAQADGLLVLFGRSDDLVEARGFFDDEIGICEGLIRLHARGFLEEHGHCECRFCGYEKLAKALPAITVKQDRDIMWTLTTGVPSESFVVKDDGEDYCRGLVINARNLPLLYGF